MRNLDDFTVRAKLPRIELNQEYVMAAPILEVHIVNSSVSYLIKGAITVTINDVELIFHGEIHNVKEVTGLMKGSWSSPLGLENLHLTQVKLTGTLDHEGLFQNIIVRGLGILGSGCLDPPLSDIFDQIN